MVKIGSLFSGAGGLDMAVEAVFGGRTVWHSEIDKAASKVLAHRWPDVPNLGSVTEIDWATVEPVDVLCGGFPCQDVSAAGKRAGIKDGTRSGLWAVFADAIDALRPQVVVIENVRGLLSATAHRNVEPDSGTLGDRAGGPVLRAAGAVLGDLSDLGYDAVWATVSAASVGAPHRRERVFIVASSSDAGNLRSRRETDNARGRESDIARRGGRRQPEGSGTALEGGAQPLGAHVELLPTPCAQQSGNTPENHLAKKPGRNVVTNLAILVGNGLLETGGALLPTPNAQDGNGGGRYSSEGHQSTLPGEVRLLPSPKASDGSRQDCEAERNRNTPSLVSVAHYLPTPTASDCTGGGQDPARRVGHTSQLIDEVLTTQWGKYAAAIARWEHVAGAAPAPTEPNRNNKPRLNPAFSEWMMGWPAGWVTDPAIGISRNDQLRIVGNGVCSQQAVAAMRYLLAVTA